MSKNINSQIVVRYFIKLLCVVSLIISSSYYPVMAPRAHAQSEQERSLEDELKDLRASLFGSGNPKASSLDPFSLTRQVVKDDRQDYVDAAVERAYLDNFNDKKNYLENQKKELLELRSEARKKLNTAKRPDQIENINRIIYDINSRIAVVDIEFSDLDKFDPKNPNRIDLAHMVDTDLSIRHYWGNKLKVKTFGEDGKELEVLNQKDFTESLSPRFQKEGLDSRSSSMGFSLHHPKSDLELNTFNISPESIIFYGRYLVFTERDSNSSDEFISLKFIDLDYYKTNIGNAPLPVYTLPIKKSTATQNLNLSIQKGKLYLDSQMLSYEQIHIISASHHTLFNVSVAMIDGRTYDNALPLTENIYDLFVKSMDNQSELFKEQFNAAIDATPYLTQQVSQLQIQRPVDVNSSKSLVEKSLNDGKVSDEEAKVLSDKILERQNLTLTNKARANGNKLFTRIRLLFLTLLKPRPEGSVKLRNAILISALGSSAERSEVLSQRKNFAKIFKYGAGATGAVLAGMALPEPYTFQLQQGLDLTYAVYEHFKGYLQHTNYGANFGVLAKDAFDTSVSGVFYFYDSYLSDGKWVKFLYGLGTMVSYLLLPFLAIHMTINSVYAIWKTARQYKKDKTNSTFSFIKQWGKSFSYWAKRDSETRLKIKSRAEKESLGINKNIQLTEEETKILFEHLERLKSKREDIRSVRKDLLQIQNDNTLDNSSKDLLKGYAETSTDYASKDKFYTQTKTHLSEIEEKTKYTDAKISTGLAHTYLSYAALSNTFGTNGHFWNYIFIPRTLWLTPKAYIMAAVYPNFIRIAATHPSGEQKYPSIYNQGTAGWIQKGANLFTSKKALNRVSAFERNISQLEDRILRLSLSEAQQALIKSIKDPQKILTLLDASHIPTKGPTAPPSTGIASLYNKKLKSLTKKERTFFNSYFSKYYELAMKEALKVILEDPFNSLNPDNFAKKIVSDIRKGTLDPEKFKINSNETLHYIEKLVQQTRISTFEVKTWANKVTNDFSYIGTRVKSNFKNNLLARINPQVPSIKRKIIAGKQLKKPKALDRAVRKEVASLSVDTLINVIFALTLYAGVQSGALMPFDPNGLNTETHLNYFSRYTFYNGLVPGIVLGLLASTWMKVQMDQRIDSMGGFDQALLNKDSKKSFFRLYLRNLVMNPKNKWLANQAHYLKIITANLAPALLTIGLSNYIGLGRFDLDSFLIGYLTMYTSFLTGFNLKVDQAFELSSQWISEKIPRKIRSHPEALKYINKKIQRKRFYFTILENIWSTIVTENIAGSMLNLKDNATMGTRAFVRMVFGGETPTTLIQKTSDLLTQAFYKVPGMEAALDTVTNFFTNNYEAFERYPEELLQQPAESRIVENPNLPNNIPAEILGKLTAAIGVVGSYTSLPYIYSYYKERLSESSVQKKGKDFLESQKKAPKVLSCKSIL